MHQRTITVNKVFFLLSQIAFSTETLRQYFLFIQYLAELKNNNIEITCQERVLLIFIVRTCNTLRLPLWWLQFVFWQEIDYSYLIRYDVAIHFSDEWISH